MHKFARYIFLLIPIFALSSCGEGCGIPDHPIYIQCFYYYTDDMTPTLVKFQREQDAEPVVTFSVPKAYIITALPYVKRRSGRSKGGTSIEAPVLPDEINPHSVSLWVGSKTGKPLKLTERNGYRTEYGHTVKLSGNFTGAKLSSYGPPECAKGRQWEKLDEVGVYSIYRTCVLPSSHNKPEYGLFGDVNVASTEQNAYRGIHCSINPGGKRKNLCRHSLRLRDGLEMYVWIKSFRTRSDSFEEGLLMAEKDVAFILRTICPMVGCDPKYTSYYDNLGEN